MKADICFFFRLASFAAAVFVSPKFSLAIPDSPLSGEYDLTGSESVGNTWGGTYQIDESGVLNISGGGILTVTYGQNEWGTLTNNGVINIGAKDSAGTLIVDSPNSFTSGWAAVVGGSGTVNIGEMGSLTFTGYIPSYWGVSVHIGDMDLAGSVSVIPSAGVDSYFRVDNLTVRENGSFDSGAMHLSAQNGVWDIYGGGISAPKLRVASGEMTVNLRGENLLENLRVVSIDSNTGTTVKMNVFADNIIQNLEVNANSVMEFSISGGSRLMIKNFSTKDNNNVYQAENIEAVFHDYSNGSFFIANSDYWIEDNRLYIPAADTYVTLTAYDGEGGLLSGEWSFEWNAQLNLNELVLTVPEPAAFAAALGAFALAFALRGRAGR
mgnify:CR=1 FL=1